MAVRLLIALVSALALVGGGYWWGHTDATEASQIKAVKDEREAREQYDREVKRGDRAVSDLIATRRELEDNFYELQGAFDAFKKRSPLLVARPAAGCPGLGAVAAAGSGGAAHQALGPDHPAADPPGDPGGLTDGAVWMWNSALAGADHPAGACGLADTSKAACDADAGVTLAEAWANHALNARLCAEDRLNHQRLIDYLTDRP